MNRFFVLFMLVFCAFGQEPNAANPTPSEPPAKVLNFAIERVGFLRDVNYGYVEWFQIRGTKHPRFSVILPDVGMIFFDNIGRYRELFIGAGFEVQVAKSLVMDHEAYLAQATGPDGHGKIWYQPWTRLEYDFPNKLVAESVFFPYIPLNGGPTQFVMERSKLEYTGFKRVNFGGGYGAYQDFKFTRWQSKPFATITLKTEHLGSFEIWIQSFPHDGFQFQFRHAFAWHTRH